MVKRTYTPEQRRRINDANRAWDKRNPEKVKRVHDRYYKSSKHRFKRKLWDNIDDDLEVMTSPLSDHELSEKLERSVMAIQIRRSYLRKSGIVS
jgi:hypothetical protein